MRLAQLDSLPSSGRRPALSTVLCILCVFILAPAWGSSVAAQTVGRLQVDVRDSANEPIADASLSLRSDDSKQISLEATSNQKGRALFTLRDATLHYRLHVEADGYGPADTEVDPKVGTITRLSVSLFADQALPAVGGSGSGAFSDAVVTDTDAEPGPQWTDAERLHNQGVEALRTGHNEEAAGLFEQAVQTDPQLATSWSALAGVRLLNGDSAGAVEAATALLGLAPDSPRAWGILYDAHQRLGNKSEANEARRRLEAMGSGSDRAALLYNQGTEAWRVGDLVGAASAFESALEEDANLAPAIFGLARVDLRRERHAEALAHTERLHVLEPDHTGGLRVRWEALNALGRTAEAQTTYDRLAELDPGTLQIEAQESLRTGKQLFDANKLAAANGHFEKALRLDPDLAEAHWFLGLIAVNADDSASARKHLEAFLTAAPLSENAAVARQMLEHL